MNINDLIEQLKTIEAANASIREPLSYTWADMSLWQDEINAWVDASEKLQHIIVQLEAHSGPTE